MKAPSKVHMAHSVALAFLSAIAAASASAQDALVVDALTKAPLEGVFVVADWRGQAFVAAHSSGGCYHVKLSRSDRDGRFHVSLLSGNFNPLITDRRRGLALYKPGYEIKFFDRIVEKRTELRRFTGTFPLRLEEYQGLWRKDCPETRTLRPLLEAINAEAQSLARSPDELKKVAYYQLQLDTESMGYEAAHYRYEEHVRRIEREARGK